jgi:hypothetical protein
MTSNKRSLWIGLVVGTLAFLANPAFAAHHEAAEAAEVPAQVTAGAWDQAVVTELALTLKDTVADVRNMARQNPPAVGAGQAARAQHQARDDLRVLQSVTRSYHQRLAKGEGRDKTLGTFKRIRLLRRDLEEKARRVMVPQATLDKFAVAQGVLDQLAAYYPD